MLEQPARFVSLLCPGLAAGIALCIFFAERVGTDDARFYTQLMQMLSRALSFPAVVLGAVGLVAMVTDATLLYRRGGGVGLWLAAIAVALTIGALALTKLGHFPINDRILGWAAMNPPADWQTVQSRWSTLHVARTICACFAFALLVLSNVLRG